MKTRGSLGWIFLAVVLAVPALMYYKSYVAKDRENKMADRIKKRVPEGGLFPEPAGAAKLTNPIGAPASTPEPGAPQAVEAGVAAGAETASQAAAAVVDATAPQAEPAPQPAAVEAPAAAPQAPAPSAPAPQAQAAPGVEVAVSTADLAAVDWRDPLLSPYDQFLIEQDELERLIKRKEVEDQARQAKARKDKPVEQTLSLQGIVAMPEGNKAIINNDMFGEGEWVGRTGIKVMKILPSSVTFSHKGRTFTKHMQ
ncbi:MAG: hypothetical protein HY748_10220 [Elusimicrobia bacterium]|nr:hypothetical protein [Elusimicrobiota bacterium]